MKAILIGLGLVAALAQSAAADPTVLRFTPLTQSGTAGYDQFYKPWADKVNAVAPDALRLDIREGTSIANITNVYERVKSDVTHIGFTLFNYVAGKFPLAEVGVLPFTAENAEIGTVALWRLYQTGMLDAEFDEVKPLMLIALPQSLLHLTKAPKSLDDLSGLRVIGATQMTALSAKYLGTQAITLSSPEVYTAILRGTADGAVLSWNPYFTFKLGEVTSYHVDAPLGTAAGMLFMSRRVYDSLSPESKHALDVNSGEAASRDWARWWDRDNEMSRESAKRDPKHTVVTLDPAMRQKWSAKLDGAIAEWAKSRPGIDQALVTFKRLVAEVQAEH